MKLKSYVTLALGVNGVRTVQLTSDTAPAPPEPAIFLGDLEHVGNVDNLPGMQQQMVNHSLYHHVADLLYRQHGIEDMSRIKIVLNTEDGPVPLPTELDLTGTQFARGLVGSTNTSKNAARTYFRGGLTAWAGMITGTEATLTAFTEYTTAGTALVEVSIDGGAFTVLDAPAGVCELFKDLPQANRLVVIRFGAVHGDVSYIVNADVTLNVKGADGAAVMPYENWVSQTSDNWIGVALDNVAGYSPKLLATGGTVYTSNTCSVALRGPFKELLIVANGPGNFAYSKNGGAPVYLTWPDEDQNPVGGLRIPLDGSLATYHVWNGGMFHNTGGHFAVTGDVPNQLAKLNKIDQYGDSVTAGAGPGANAVHTEIMRVAANLGMLGSAVGISGLTIEGELEVIDRIVPLKVIGPNDVAILAIGGNNANEGFDQTEQDNYGLCIDKLLAAGYGKVLCRGILPLVGSESMINGLNDILHGVMDAKANPKLIFIDPRTWGTYDTQDGVHPTMAGYDTIASKAEPAYRAALGL